MIVRHDCCRLRIDFLLSSAVLAVVLFSGCGSEDGPSEYDQMVANEKSGADKLQSVGAKIEKKQYPPYGEAYAVDLSGQTITDDTLEELRRLRHISELNLSGSTLSDAHAAKLNSQEVSGVLLKLDISKTGISDTGLAEFKNMGLLRELNVTGSKVTKEGIDKFQQSRQKSPNVNPAFRTVTVKS